MKRFLKRSWGILLFVIPTISCATVAPEQTTVATRQTAVRQRQDPFAIDVLSGHLTDKCMDALTSESCQKVQSLNAALATMEKTNSSQLAVWSFAVNAVRNALVAGFTDPAVFIDIDKNKFNEWRSPDQISAIPVTVRIEAASGLERSKGQPALQAALTQLVTVSESNILEWNALIKSQTGGLDIPSKITSKRDLITMQVKWGTNKKTISVPAHLLDVLSDVISKRFVLVSLVTTDADLNFRDLASHNVDVPPPFIFSLEGKTASLVESPASRERLEVNELQVQVSESCQGMRAEVRFIDASDWPTRRFSIRQRMEGGVQ